jgi:hypothetical protein
MVELERRVAIRKSFTTIPAAQLPKAGERSVMRSFTTSGKATLFRDV